MRLSENFENRPHMGLLYCEILSVFRDLHENWPILRKICPAGAYWRVLEPPSVPLRAQNFLREWKRVRETIPHSLRAQTAVFSVHFGHFRCTKSGFYARPRPIQGAQLTENGEKLHKIGHRGHLSPVETSQCTQAHTKLSQEQRKVHEKQLCAIWGAKLSYFTHFLSNFGGKHGTSGLQGQEQAQNCLKISLEMLKIALILLKRLKTQYNYWYHSKLWKRVHVV